MDVQHGYTTSRIPLDYQCRPWRHPGGPLQLRLTVYLARDEPVTMIGRFGATANACVPKTSGEHTSSLMFGHLVTRSCPQRVASP
jgi:hypothetical protein